MQYILELMKIAGSKAGAGPYSCKKINQSFAKCGNLHNHMRKMHSATDEEIAHL